ncbi:unnamed protein product, partial [Polarella glacialis]
DLLESKDFQEFKREWKQAIRTEEIERIKAQLAVDMDNAHWQVELQKAILADRQSVLQERLEDSEELREIRQNERLREKASQEGERAHEQVLDFAHKAYQISSEKEELMRNVQLLRARQKVPAGPAVAKASAAFWPSVR